jgi:preprotein translocase SecE subunit
MGRAARRQQERQTRRQPTQRASSGRTFTAPPTPTAPGAPRVGGAWWKPRWAMDIWSELQKVTWPTRQETTHLTFVVIVISLLFGVLLGTADFAFSWIVEQTILR